MAKDVEKAREYRRVYEKKHPDRVIASRRKYKEAHRQELREYNTQYSREWRKKYPERVKARKATAAYKEKDKLYKRRERHLLKIAVFEAYGGTFCACCGVKHIEFLTLDHINGDGATQRRNLKKLGSVFYYWLKRQGYPPGFRVLCFNCNCALGFFGHCPHQLAIA